MPENEPSEITEEHDAWKAALADDILSNRKNSPRKQSVKNVRDWEEEIDRVVSLGDECSLAPSHVPTDVLFRQEERTAEALVLAHVDALTMVPNRRALDEMIELVKKDGLSHVGVLFIDINNFRRFNKKFSQEIGDHVLRLVAQAIGGNISAEDIEFRFGGEEFIVLLKKNIASQKNVDSAGQRLADIFNQSDGRDSIGIERTSQSISVGGVYVSHTQDLAEEIKKAEKAMKRAKRQTKIESNKNQTWIICQREGKQLRLPRSKYLPFVAAK